MATELTRLEEARANGAAVYPVTFSPYNLFWRTEVLEIDQGEAEQDDRILTAVEDAGIEPMGVFPTWIFPPSAGAALTPPSVAASLSDVPEARISCVPDPGSPEYHRLDQLRQAMFRGLARRFPGVRHWIVGYEPSFPFFDCSGRQLELESMIPYIADTLKGSRQALRQANSEALVVAHFLGARGVPIEIRGKLVQPSEILAGLAAEIESRGDSAKDYYDLSITDFDPSLALDRYPEPTAFVPFSPFSTQRSLRAAKSSPLDGDSILNAGGWSTSPYWVDYLSTARSNLYGSGTDWNIWRTNAVETYIKPSPVSSGVAHMVMGPPPILPGTQINTVLGGVTKPTVDVIPDEFFGQSGSVRHRWIAVMDLYPVQDPNPNGIHAGVFLRVSDRSWGTPEQTRIGSIVWGGYLAGNPTCASSYCGSLEFIGDDGAAHPLGSAGKLALVDFNISEFPWSFPSHQYRLQILEEERYSGIFWDAWWQAQLVDLTDLQTLGSSSWISEWTLLNTYGIVAPNLPGTKVAVGFGPGQSLPFEGALDVNLIGTAYWIY